MAKEFLIIETNVDMKVNTLMDKGVVTVFTPIKMVVNIWVSLKMDNRMGKAFFNIEMD